MKKTRKKPLPRHEIAVAFRAPLGSIGAQLFQDAISHVLQARRITRAVISCAVVTDEEIHGINRRYLGHDEATDIITFPLEEKPLEAELVISADTARRQAREYGVTVREECVRLAIHGILHLAGYDDTDADARRRMKRMEDTLVVQFMNSDRTKG
ncbi:MAG: rRNA maturation RNase YbeY [Bacteroidota bacterium]|nr:rRNA maturation RNase YbeY [Bacteroidota bacterium]